MNPTLRKGAKSVDVKALQERLNKYLLPNPKLIIDGNFGPATFKAIRAFQAQNGLSIDGIAGPQTWKCFKQLQTGGYCSAPPLVLPTPTTSTWIKIAKQELGQKEIAGSKHNPRILAYHVTTTLKAANDETPWCSSFVNWVLKKAGITGTNSAAAASWLNWGKPTMTKVGAITVIRNKNAANSNLTYSGNHVGFLLKETATHYFLLGGNQSDQVKVSRYPKKSWDLRGHRWPK